MKAKGLTRETICQFGVKKLNFPKFGIGDTIAISQRIIEGDKQRLQVFEGDVIAIRNSGVASTFTVRKIGANSVAVERVFPYHSPKIESIKLVRRGKVCRAKLYYIRERVGKAARVTEMVLTKEQKEQMAQKANQSQAVL
ncbi:50S ribosomal protein L19 [Candidatus Dependentiae bacterium]|nr:50S ribosomal protein L19 [Candidatus Dependentiae bacterium]